LNKYLRVERRFETSGARPPPFFFLAASGEHFSGFSFDDQPISPPFFFVRLFVTSWGRAGPNKAQIVMDSPSKSTNSVEYISVFFEFDHFFSLTIGLGFDWRPFNPFELLRLPPVHSSPLSLTPKTQKQPPQKPKPASFFDTNRSSAITNISCFFLKVHCFSPRSIFATFLDTLVVALLLFIRKISTPFLFHRAKCPLSSRRVSFFECISPLECKGLRVGS